MADHQNAVIVSIGAVEFNLETGETGDVFYQKIDIQSCLNIGLEVKGSTIYWWLKQNEKARLELQLNTNSIIDVLKDFASFVTPFGDNKYYKVWGNPASFDLGILSNAYNKAKMTIPWFYRNERDMRTLVGLNPIIKDTFPKQGTEHHPIDDCKHQIGICCATWSSLQVKQVA